MTNPVYSTAIVIPPNNNHAKCRKNGSLLISCFYLSWFSGSSTNLALFVMQRLKTITLFSLPSFSSSSSFSGGSSSGGSSACKQNQQTLTKFLLCILYLIQFLLYIKFIGYILLWQWASLKHVSIFFLCAHWIIDLYVVVVVAFFPTNQFLCFLSRSLAKSKCMTTLCQL